MILTITKFGKSEFQTKGGSAFSMVKPRKVSMGDGVTATQWEPVHVYRNAKTILLNHDGTTAPIPGAQYAVTGHMRLIGSKQVTPKEGTPYTLPLYAVSDCGRMLQLKKGEDGKWQLPTGELYEEQAEDVPANAATDVAVPAGADAVVPF